MSRRPNGEGSVYRAGNGWMAQVTFVDPTTGRTRLRRRRAWTKADAVQRLRTMLRELEDFGQVPDATRTVDAMVGDYLLARAGRQLELGARVSDQWATKLIRAGLGDMVVTNLSVQDCDRFLVAAAAGSFGGPLGRDQLRRLRGRLIRAIDNDRRRGLVSRNVAELSIIPEVSTALVPRRPRRAISADELRALLQASNPITAVLVDLSGRHGLRPAEARAMRWSRVDLDGLTIRVDAQINRRDEVVKPKTKRSVRTLRIDTATAERLELWRAKQERQRERACRPPVGWDHFEVCSASVMGPPVRQ